MNNYQFLKRFVVIYGFMVMLLAGCSPGAGTAVSSTREGATLTPTSLPTATSQPPAEPTIPATETAVPPTPTKRPPEPTPTFVPQPALWLSVVEGVAIFDGPSEDSNPLGELAPGAAVKVIGDLEDDWFPIACPEGIEERCWVAWNYNALYSYEAVEPLTLVIPEPASLNIESTNTMLSPDGRWQVETTRTETVTLAGDSASFFYVKMTVDSIVDDLSWTLAEEWHAGGLGEEGAPAIFHWSADGRYLYYTSTFDFHGVWCALYINVADLLERLDLSEGTVARMNPPQVWGLLTISPDEKWMAIGTGEGLTVRDMAAAFDNRNGNSDTAVWQIPMDQIGPDPISRVSWTADSGKVLVETTAMSEDCQILGTTNWELDMASGIFRLSDE